MSNKLTKFDIDQLIDSLDVWEQHSHLLLQSHDAMRTMYTDPQQLAEFDDMTRDKRSQLIKEISAKKDMAIILKYKLVKAKDSIVARQMLDKLSQIGGIDEQGEPTG